MHDLNKSGLSCSECYKRVAAAKEQGRSIRPMCSTKACEASELMLDEYGAWIGMLNVLKAEVYQGQALLILDRAEAELQDLEMFARLDNVLNAWRKEQLAKK